MIHSLCEKKSSGFTLIELMVVIAILSILAAIAIPNYISYRNTSFCSKTESDANYITSEIADYYALPTRTQCVTTLDLKVDEITSNPISVFCANNNPNDNISIVVTDISGRCPINYQSAVNVTENPTGYWDGSQHFIKIVE